MSATPRLGLPFLNVGQAQKEFTHNEALQTLDIVVAGAVEEPPRAAPPDSPAEGACYIVEVMATGDWAGHDGCVAAWTSGGWRFVAPIEGMSFRVRSTGTTLSFADGAWQSGAAIASPAGGATIDDEARAAVDAILAALRLHGLIAS